MTLDLSRAVVYDCETFPNCFTLNAQSLNDDASFTWEISEFRDDRRSLIDWFGHLERHKIPMFSFFGLKFDYPVIHWLYRNPTASVADIYEKSQRISADFDNFGNMIWQSDRFAPQIDVFKINHFDNRAKTTSLKALQFNMRSPSLVDMPVEFGKHLTEREVRTMLIPYNVHDTAETKRFVHYCMPAIQFRIGLLDTLKGDVLNFSDVKIGASMLEQRIGDEVCYDRSSGKKEKRQTIRTRIALNDIIFPYVYFNNAEFARVLTWMKQQTLTPEDLDDPDAAVKTKGVFKGIIANVAGLEFKFGTGGMHASVKPQRIHSSATHAIVDKDVKGFYPSLAVVNKLAPAHLGEAYTREYAKLGPERDEWQKKKGKKCVEANALKLASNGPWGQSNNAFTIFYDSQYAMTIPINGQLLLCMLVDWLKDIPTIQFIQANTDGITYRIQRDFIPQAELVCAEWEKYTLLTLETAEYKSMFIRDVNNYVAVDLKDGVKQKGAYWHPDPLNYAQSISEAQPPAWHKDLSNVVSIQAAVAAMVYGIDPEIYIRCNTNPFDFMLRAKVGNADKLMLGELQLQKTSRYYVANRGGDLRKISPPSGKSGAFKRKNGVSEYEYQNAMNANNWQWTEAVCTKNKSKYADRITAFEAGFKVVEVNNADAFDFTNVNYSYYVNEARKLIIS